jgi:hypothetical protein
MSEWYTEFEQDVIQKLKGHKRSDLRFFRIDEYLRMAEKIDALAPLCRECHSFRFEMEKQRDSLVKAVSEPGRERRELDRLQSRMSDHMRKQHGFFPAYYFTYRYSFFLTLFLLGVAFLVYLFSPATDVWYFFAPAFATGVITGQVIGGKKDRRIRETNKIL